MNGSQKITTLRLYETTRDSLRRIEIYPNETFDKILNRLIKEHQEK